MPLVWGFTARSGITTDTTHLAHPKHSKPTALQQHGSVALWTCVRNASPGHLTRRTLNGGRRHPTMQTRAHVTSRAHRETKSLAKMCQQESTPTRGALLKEFGRCHGLPNVALALQIVQKPLRPPRLHGKTTPPTWQTGHPFLLGLPLGRTSPTQVA